MPHSDSSTKSVAETAQEDVTRYNPKDNQDLNRLLDDLKAEILSYAIGATIDEQIYPDDIKRLLSDVYTQHIMPLAIQRVRLHEEVQAVNKKLDPYVARNTLWQRLTQPSRESLEKNQKLLNDKIDLYSGIIECYGFVLQDAQETLIRVLNENNELAEKIDKREVGDSVNKWQEKNIELCEKEVAKALSKVTKSKEIAPSNNLLTFRAALSERSVPSEIIIAQAQKALEIAEKTLEKAKKPLSEKEKIREAHRLHVTQLRENHILLRSLYAKIFCNLHDISEVYLGKVAEKTTAYAPASYRTSEIASESEVSTLFNKDSHEFISAPKEKFKLSRLFSKLYFGSYENTALDDVAFERRKNERLDTRAKSTETLRNPSNSGNDYAADTLAKQHFFGREEEESKTGVNVVKTSYWNTADSFTLPTSFISSLENTPLLAANDEKPVSALSNIRYGLGQGIKLIRSFLLGVFQVPLAKLFKFTPVAEQPLYSSHSYHQIALSQERLKAQFKQYQQEDYQHYHHQHDQRFSYERQKMSGDMSYRAFDHESERKVPFVSGNEQQKDVVTQLRNSMVIETENYRQRTAGYLTTHGGKASIEVCDKVKDNDSLLTEIPNFLETGNSGMRRKSLKTVLAEVDTPRPIVKKIARHNKRFYDEKAYNEQPWHRKCLATLFVSERNRIAAIAKTQRVAGGIKHYRDGDSTLGN